MFYNAGDYDNCRKQLQKCNLINVLMKFKTINFILRLTQKLWGNIQIIVKSLLYISVVKCAVDVAPCENVLIRSNCLN